MSVRCRKGSLVVPSVTRSQPRYSPCRVCPAAQSQHKEIRTIYDLLDLIRVRSGMWIGFPSITRLELFIAGFQTGVRAAHASLDQESPPFPGFHDWVAARLGRPKTGEAGA